MRGLLVERGVERGFVVDERGVEAMAEDEAVGLVARLLVGRLAVGVEVVVRLAGVAAEREVADDEGAVVVDEAVLRRVVEVELVDVPREGRALDRVAEAAVEAVALVLLRADGVVVEDEDDGAAVLLALADAAVGLVVFIAQRVLLGNAMPCKLLCPLPCHARCKTHPRIRRSGVGVVVHTPSVPRSICNADARDIPAPCRGIYGRLGALSRF